MRLRTIKPGFFQNEDLAALPPMARLLFAGLWCYCDREGRCEDRPKRIKAAIFPYDEADVVALIDALVAGGWVSRYAVDGQRLLAVCKFAAHQRPHKNEQGTVLPGPIGDGTTKAVPQHNQGSAMDAQSLGAGVLGLGAGKQEPPVVPLSGDGGGKKTNGHRDPKKTKEPKCPASRRLLEHFDARLPEICKSAKTPRRTDAQVDAADRLCSRFGDAAVGSLIDFFAEDYQPGADFDWREHITSLVYIDRKWPKLDGERRRQATNGHARGILS